MPKLYVVVSPDQDLVFNSHSQNCYFTSLKSCQEGIREELDEPDSEDEYGRIHTLKDETGYSVSSYKIFELSSQKAK